MRLLSIPVITERPLNGYSLNIKTLNDIHKKKQAQPLDNIAVKNAEFFEEEMDKLDRWAEDRKKSLEINIKDLDLAIKQQKTMSRKIAWLEEKHDEYCNWRTVEPYRLISLTFCSLIYMCYIE